MARPQSIVGEAIVLGLLSICGISFAGGERPIVIDPIYYLYDDYGPPWVGTEMMLHQSHYNADGVHGEILAVNKGYSVDQPIIVEIALTNSGHNEFHLCPADPNILSILKLDVFLNGKSVEYKNLGRPRLENAKGKRGKSIKELKTPCSCGGEANLKCPGVSCEDYYEYLIVRSGETKRIRVKLNNPKKQLGWIIDKPGDVCIKGRLSSINTHRSLVKMKNGEVDDIFGETRVIYDVPLGELNIKVRKTLPGPDRENGLPGRR